MQIFELFVNKLQKDHSRFQSAFVCALSRFLAGLFKWLSTSSPSKKFVPSMYPVK